MDSPSETKLLLDAILDLGRSAKKAGLKLKQDYRFVASSLTRKASGYEHARQFNRLKTTNKKLKKILCKLKRITNSATRCNINMDELPSSLQERLSRASKVLHQQQKNKDKLLVWHAPEVECIAKGKVKKPYEFGGKVSLATNVNRTKGGHFILSCNALHGKPYDGQP